MTNAESLARCTLMPSASATTSRPWIARQARPVLERSRLRPNSSVAAAAASRTKYQWRASVSGDSMTMPVEKPRRVSYSPPAKVTMKCSASVETARYRPRRRRLGRPEIRPSGGPGPGGGGLRKPHGRAELLEQDPGGERAGGEESRVAERDLARIAGEQHQRHRAD